MNTQEKNKDSVTANARNVRAAIRSGPLVISILILIGAAIGGVSGAVMHHFGSGFFWGAIAGAGTWFVLIAIFIVRAVLNRQPH